MVATDLGLESRKLASVPSISTAEVVPVTKIWSSLGLPVMLTEAPEI